MKQQDDKENEEAVMEDTTGEVPLSVILEHQDDSKLQMKVFKRLKGLMVFHSVQTVIIHDYIRLYVLIFIIYRYMKCGNYV